MSSANLFGTFLDSFAASSAARPSTLPAPAAGAPAAAPLADPFGGARELGPLEAKTPDPVDALLKALQAGPRPFKDLLPVAGNSAGQLLQLRDRVVAANWVAADPEGRLALTEQGAQIADLIV